MKCKKILIILAISLLVFLPVSAGSLKSNDVEELVIHDTTVSTGYIGNGVQFGLYEHCDDAASSWGKAFGMYMDDNMWNKTFKRLDFMRVGLARTMISSKSFCYRGQDSQGNPIIQNDYKIDLAEKWLNYCDNKDVTLMWGEWGTGNIAPVTDPLWANTIIGYADYLINTRNHPSVKYFIGINEPDGNWSDATGGSFDIWETATNNVYDAMVNKGLTDRLQIAGPDACPNTTGTSFLTNTTAKFENKIGLWNIHIYPYPNDIRSGSFESKIQNWHNILGKDKKLVLGEIGMKYKAGTPEHAENLRRAKEDPMQKSDTTGSANMFVYDYFYAIDIADIYIQCMRGGMSGACSWVVCDAMFTSSGQKMKRWGLWNIFGTKMGNPADEDIRPWYYTLSLMSRYFPKGTDILTVDASSYEGVRAIAGTYQGHKTIAVVNNSATARSVKFTMEGESARLMRKYVCTEESRPVDSDDLPVPAESKYVNLSAGEEVELPPLSFVLLTSLDFNEEITNHTFYVSTEGSDTNDGSQGTPFATINHAVTSVPNNSSAIIYLGAGETFTEYNVRIEDNTNKTIELIGNNTVFQAAAVKQTASTGRMLFSGYGSNLKVSGIIFKNGYQSSADGGAIYFRGVTLEVNSCKFIDNIADNHGGAIASIGNDLIVENSYFDGNISVGGYAGAVLHTGAGTIGNSLIIRNSTFNGNKTQSTESTSGMGSAVHTHASASDIASVEITNCVFYKNESARTSMGAVDLGNSLTSKSYLVNNTFYTNTQMGVRVDGLNNKVYLVNNAIIGGAVGLGTVYALNTGTKKRTQTIDAWNNVIAATNKAIGTYVDDPSLNADKVTNNNTVEIFSESFSLSNVGLNEDLSTDKSIPYLAISSSASVLVNAGLDSKVIESLERVPSTDMLGMAKDGTKDIGAFELDQTTTVISPDFVPEYIKLIDGKDFVSVVNLSQHPISLQVMSVEGKLLKNIRIDNAVTVNKGDLPRGLLLFVANDGQWVIAKKVIN
ncbi:MAG: glycosyl hydrolase [Lentimicrobium sp.]|jgi:hypothetical protein|nr:glycosyl hydrolase [Lentimicrobium sp.]